MIQDLTAVSGDEDEVFYANSEFSGQINTRFDRKSHPFADFIGIGLADISCFMFFHADGVAETVRKIFAVSGIRNNVPCRLVKVAETNTGTDELFGGFVGSADDVMDGGIVRVCRLTEKGPGHVGAVAVLFTSHVNDDAVSGMKNGTVRFMMGVCAVCTKRNDG